MSIISKYLTREIFKYFGIILVTVICIFLAVDFFEKIDNFIEAGLPFSKTISFFSVQDTVYHCSDCSCLHSSGSSHCVWPDEQK